MQRIRICLADLRSWMQFGDQIWCSFTAKKHRQRPRQETHGPEAPQAYAHSNKGIRPDVPAQRANCMHCKQLTRCRLVAAGHHALLVVAGGLIVGVNDGVGGHAVGAVGLFACNAVSGPDLLPILHTTL